MLYNLTNKTNNKKINKTIKQNNKYIKCVNTNNIN